MTELPERIWACMGGPMVGLFVSGGNNGGWPEYVRADIVQALTAERDEALEDLSASQGYIADAVFALDKQKKAEAERDRLREALEYILAECTLSDNTMPSVGAIKYAARAALKGESHE